MEEDTFFQELTRIVLEKKPNKQELSKIKNTLAKEHKRKKSPTDFEILIHADERQTARLKKLLQTKPTRTISGVAPVALMTKPINCKHGRCTYCPGGVGSAFGDMPQSYTGKEPSTMRGIRNNFDPYLIMFNRLEQFILLGHPIEKIEAIIMGGTFLSFPRAYQDGYITETYQALNDFSRTFFPKGKLNLSTFKEFFELPSARGDVEREKRIRNRVLQLKCSSYLLSEQRKNEYAAIRCVALCLETRPDYARKPHINSMLAYGTTRVEMGVQSVFDDALKKTNRSHTVEDSVNATRWMKDSLLKVGYHMMLGLPGVSVDQDHQSLRAIIEDERFKPDALKLYPCMVMPGTPLEKQFKRGEYAPLETNESAKIIARFKRIVPRYLRIMRVQRDIPTKVTVAGVDRTNLRQYVDEECRNQGIHCECIRCREPKQLTMNPSKIEMRRMSYTASSGQEEFISFDEAKQDKLLGFCRLRMPGAAFRPEFSKKTAGIRELHVYGPAAELGKSGVVQHRGLGKKLLLEAERIARDEYGMKDLLVISGVGARDYYRKLGYRRKGVYMRKVLI